MNIQVRSDSIYRIGRVGIYRWGIDKLEGGLSANCPQQRPDEKQQETSQAPGNRHHEQDAGIRAKRTWGGKKKKTTQPNMNIRGF